MALSIPKVSSEALPRRAQARLGFCGIRGIRSDQTLDLFRIPQIFRFWIPAIPAEPAETCNRTEKTAKTGLFPSDKATLGKHPSSPPPLPLRPIIGVFRA